MKKIESKKDIAEKVFGMTYHSLYMWTTKKGVPRGQLERVDKLLCIREEQNGVSTGQSALSRRLDLREPKELARRLGNAFPGFFINDKGGEDD